MKAVVSTQGPANRIARNGEPHGASLPPDALQQLACLLKSQCKQYRKKLRRCQKKFSEKAVHDSRVEARRLISIVELLGPFLPAARVKKIERLLKQHLDTFDVLRDTQVQLATLQKLERAFPAARLFKAHLSQKEERLARSTRKEVKRLKTSRAAKLVKACRENIDAARRQYPAKIAEQLLLAAVARAFARTRLLKDRIEPSDTKTIHCTRVAFKKFRYMMETLAEFAPSPTRKRVGELRDYQTLMGDVQDAEVLLQAFDKFLCKQELDEDSARRLLHALVQRRQDLIQKFLRSADELEKFWPGPLAQSEGPPPQMRVKRASLSGKGKSSLTN